MSLGRQSGGAVGMGTWKGTAEGGLQGIKVVSCPALGQGPRQQPWRAAQWTAALRTVVY